MTCHAGDGIRQESMAYRTYSQWVAERRRKDRPIRVDELDIRQAIWLLAGTEAEAYARAGALLARLEEATAPIYDARPAFLTSELDDAERDILREELTGLTAGLGDKLRALPDMGSVEAYEIMLWHVQRRRGY